MFGRKYRLLVGRAYAAQGTFSPNAPTIESEEFLGFRYRGTVEGAPLLEQGGLAERFLPSVSKIPIYKKRSPEEIQAIENAIVEGFADEDVQTYVNKYYTDPSTLEEAAGWLQFDNVVIEENHIEFTVEKIGGNSADGNEAEITIYNLDDATAALLVTLSDTQNFVELSAGYEDEGVKTIIRGNVLEVEDTLDGTERRTKLVVVDGGKFVSEQMSVRMYPKGTLVSRIVEDLQQDAALPRGINEFDEPDRTIKKPLIIHGRSVEQLKRVLDVLGYNINIQDLYINIYKRVVAEEAQRAITEATSNTAEVDRIISIAVRAPKGYIVQAMVISPSTGLLAAPTLMSNTAGMSTQEIANEPSTGVKFRHLLSGELSPNKYVRLETEGFRGNYRILSVTHVGSLEGGDWYSEVEAERIDSTGVSQPSGTEEDPANSSDRPLFEQPERLTQSEDELARQQRLKDIGLFRNE